MRLPTSSNSEMPGAHFQITTHHPEQQTPFNESELREKVVQILSNTANGCLNELGYYPGVHHRLKQLEIKNQTWQTENVKLYEDNRRLLNTVREQHERLKLISIPDLEKINRIRRLELEVQSLREAASGSSNQEGLQKEFNRLKESYRIVCNDVRRLEALLQSQRPQSQSGGPPPSQHWPHPQFHLGLPPHPVRQPSQLMQMQMAWQGGQPRQPGVIPAQHIQQGTLRQEHPLQQTQQAALQQRQPQDTISADSESRRTSTGTIVPISESSMSVRCI